MSAGRHALALALVAAAGCASSDDAPSESEPALERAAAVETFQDLVRLVKGNGSTTTIRSLDALLDRLAAESPKTLAGFALVYATRSLASASPEFPRVIAYGPGFDFDTGKNARLVLAFAGDPSKPDFQTLEVMSQDDGSPDVKLSVIRFPGNTTGTPTIEESPARCAACHGAPARPVWDTYPVWPGTYGANEDTVDARVGELANFRPLARKFGQPGRYRRLRLGERAFGDAMTFGNGPNIELGLVLSVFAARSITARVAAEPQFGPLKYALLGAGAGCFRNGADGWFSPSASAAMGIDFAEVKATTTRDIDANRVAKHQRYFNAAGHPVPAGPDGLRSEDQRQNADGFRFVSLLLGDAMRGWSTTMEPRSFSFATRGLDNVFFAVADRTRRDPVIADAVPLDAWLDPQANCSKLRAASTAAVTDSVAAAIGARAKAMMTDLASDGLDAQAPVVRCISCHTRRGSDGQPATGTTPFYPFDQPRVLGKRLAENGGELKTRMLDAVRAPADSPKRMPKAPRAPLTTAETRSLVDFIESLAGDGAL